MKTRTSLARTTCPKTMAGRLRTAYAARLLPLLLLLTLPAAVQAQYTYTTNNGTITITGYTGPDGAVTIPSTINGLPVTSIGSYAFEYRSGIITPCTNGNVVTFVTNTVVFYRYGLSSVTIPNSVVSIGDQAFCYCTSLTGFYFHGNAPSLGSDVFYGDSNATVYYLLGTTGWGPTFGGRPTMLWNPQVIPAITTQPVSQSIQASSNVTFSITASGTSPLKYQWRFNGNLIPAATNTSLSRTNVQFVNAGGYSVVVTNGYGSVTSAVAQLTVFTNLVLTQTTRAPTINEIGKPTIPTDPNHFKVFTNRIFHTGVALDPNKMTVVITHGWNGSSADWVTVTAQNIAQRIGASTVNIVAWDWTAEATSSIPDLGIIAAKTPGQGTALGTNLIAALGANYSKRIHFVGHSLGTLVNGHAANYVHAHGFAWTNTQMTLCDEAEAAWELTSSGWQLATTLPQIIISGNFSTPQRYWDRPLPEHFAWADNYISAVGLLHPDAANAILTWEYPTQGSSDFASWASDWALFHAFSHHFYEDTIEPGIYNTGGKTNATYMGFICSFEGGGTASRPATNTVFYQNPMGSGYELDLVPTTLSFATDFLNDRLWSVLATATETRDNIGWNFFGDVVGQVFGQINSVGNNVGNMFVNLSTTGGSSPQIQNLKWGPMGGPVPNGGSGSANTPAYAWIPITIPSNTVSMSFDFMLQGNSNNDSFQAALYGTNILSLETSLIQTNVTLNSGLIGVSQYAGQQVELFLGIVGGTSTNAALTVSNFQFYVTLPPSLQIQLSGTNVVLTWPLSGAGYVLQSANSLAPPVSWTTVTNVPVIVNFQYTVTNQISGAVRFYRLSE
jgi:pimeloyl-ACP methyl ester carboxylesterase